MGIKWQSVFRSSVKLGNWAVEDVLWLFDCCKGLELFSMSSLKLRTKFLKEGLGLFFITAKNYVEE